MTAGALLNQDGEAAWLRVKQHLEWCDSFALVFIFSDQPAVVAILRERLAGIYRARVTELEIPVPRTPDALLADLLPRLLNPPHYQKALDAPVWLDLTRHPKGAADGEEAAAWRDAVLQFLARLNEQREPLRRALTKPLILVLSLKDKARIKALAPDLWAIRHFSLETGHWLAAPAAERSTHHDQPDLAGPLPLSDTEVALVREWRRVKSRSLKGHGPLLAGGRALDVLITRGRIDEAREVAEWLIGTARTKLAEAPTDPQALRDLSVSLNNIGRIDTFFGDYEQARAAFGESLNIRRRLLIRDGETPDSLRDLSVSLDKLGNTYLRLGDWNRAQAAFAEFLDISRRLLIRNSETPEALRVLSISLDNVGKSYRTIGAWEQARAAFAESLELRRRLLARVGETREGLRDLSVALNNVGNADQALGNWEQARASAAESIDVARNLLVRLGETPESLRALSIALDNAGRTGQALGDWEQARAAFSEAMEIAERLAAALPKHTDYKDLPAWFEGRLHALAEEEENARGGREVRGPAAN